MQSALLTARILRHAKPIEKTDMNPLKLFGAPSCGNQKSECFSHRWLPFFPTTEGGSFNHGMLISFEEECREHQLEFDIGVSQINCWISVVSSRNE